MVVYLCTIWDSEMEEVIEDIVCANYKEVRKAYAEYLLTFDTRENWENYKNIPFEDLVDNWYLNDDFFKIKELKIRGL